MFKRISNLFRGFISLFISGFEKRNPEALLELEKENLRKQIANYNQGLAAHAGHCERLMTESRKQEQQEKELKAKAAANLKAGNRAAAGEYALQLQQLSAQLEANRKDLEQAEATYEELVLARNVAVQAAQKKIEDLRASLDDLKIKRATAELSEMATGMVSSIGGSGDTLDRLHSMVEEERQRAAGRARVAKDSLTGTDVALKKAEQEALAEHALAQFAAEEGITLPEEPSSNPNPDSSAPQKSMGPQSQ